MSRPLPTSGSENEFESRYREAEDPWNFATSPYELSRYQVILEALLRDRYRVAFEPGCSVGVLTARLALRCERVIAQDIAASAVASARHRCGSLKNVQILLGDVAVQIPDEELDLIVFSEIGYYFDAEALRRIALRLAQRLGPNGEFVAVHWLGESADHRLNGDQVHTILNDALPLLSIKRSRYAEFRLDTWVHT
jgi:protein-L-isoaspartate O-methyltransferase